MIIQPHYRNFAGIIWPFTFKKSGLVFCQIAVSFIMDLMSNNISETHCPLNCADLFSHIHTPSLVRHTYACSMVPHCLRWEFIKENKNSTKKAIKKKEKKLSFFLDHFLGRVLGLLFSYFLVFFYKFPPLDISVSLRLFIS